MKQIIVHDPPLANKAINAHRMARYRMMKDHRDFCELAWQTEVKKEIEVPVIFTAQLLIGNRYRGKRPDTDCLYMAAKTALDALVNSGGLPDDNPNHVWEIRHLSPAFTDEDYTYAACYQVWALADGEDCGIRFEQTERGC